MSTLYLTRAGGTLRYQNKCFVAEAKDEPAIAVPEFRVERVVAFGPIHITQPAISRLLAKRAEVYFLSRFGMPRGRLCPADDARSDVRIAQYRRFCDDAFRLRMAASIVAAKLTNSRQIAMRYVRNHPDSGLRPVVRELQKCARSARKADNMESLRGIEGAAAALYFDAFASMVDDPELFKGRSRRPPLDPANALLSLGYTLLGGEIAGLLFAHGLDPYIGFYHQARRGLPALAQDILEEFRAPVVDRLTLATLNTGELTARDFTSGPKGGCRLRPNSLKRFLRRYEDSLNDQFSLKNGARPSLRRAVVEQCSLIKRACRRQGEYEAFIWERG